MLVTLLLVFSWTWVHSKTYVFSLSNARQKADNEAVRKANKEHLKKFVSVTALFTGAKFFFWHFPFCLANQYGNNGCISVKSTVPYHNTLSGQVSLNNEAFITVIKRGNAVR